MNTDISTKQLKVKLIKRNFDTFTVEHKSELLANYQLIIRDFVKPSKEVNSAKDYLKCFKNSPKERRKIYFWKIPIQLSKQQYMLLSILLYEQEIIQSDFNELIKNDIKKTVSDFNRKIKKEIKKFAQKHKCVFYDKESDIFTDLYKPAFKDLIAYKSDNNKGYKLHTNYILERKEPILSTKMQ